MKTTQNGTKSTNIYFQINLQRYAAELGETVERWDWTDVLA